MAATDTLKGHPKPRIKRTWRTVLVITLAVVAPIALLSTATSHSLIRETFGFPIASRIHQATTESHMYGMRSNYRDELQAPLQRAQEEMDDASEDILKSVTDLLGTPIVNALEELHYALETMQGSYFQLWLGTWPDSIDWTAAVLGTYMSASLYSLTRSLDYILPWQSTSGDSRMQVEGQKVENEINKYFSQSVAYYFGEDAFAIRLQAYDDMLWVVLGWLENIRFIQLHTKSHYPATNPSYSAADDEEDGGQNSWYGQQFKPAFAHRARVFYDLAKQGWDTQLCGGGMIWSPYLLPYKNAITNELFISASVGMYLHFPGDKNGSPFVCHNVNDGKHTSATNMPHPVPPHDPVYLHNAINAYDWLKDSNMTNELGLYVDGFHVRHYSENVDSIGTGRCDVRNEMVYTYNQGVLLSGLRGLWESTGNISYLQDGHALVRAVLNATGWDIETSLPKEKGGRRWDGLGRGGILEDYCDAAGSCSQNGQTFKGIYFHHLTLFCEPLPTTPLIPGLTYAANAETASLHAQSCREYAAWVAHNAVAAMTTRDDKGRFGMWWGASDGRVTEGAKLPHRSVDYQNWHVWSKKDLPTAPWNELGSMNHVYSERWREYYRVQRNWDTPGPPPPWGEGEFQWPLYEQEYAEKYAEYGRRGRDDDQVTTEDLNDRGRGRTVETQGGGVAAVRAMWEFVHMYQGKQEDGS
jgi:predicted alpha-1,6-mannanase (GH76 family)